MPKDTAFTSITGEIKVPKEVVKLERPSRAQEVAGVVTGIVALFLLLSFVSYDGLDVDGSPILGGNLVGPAGLWTAYFGFSLLGAAVYLLDAFLWVLVACVFTKRSSRIRAKSVLGVLLVGILSAVVLHTLLGGEDILGGHAPGGFLGEILGEISISLVSTTGTYIIALGTILVVLLLVTELSVTAATRAAAGAVAAGGRAAGRFSVRVARAWVKEPERGSGTRGEDPGEEEKKEGKKDGDKNTSSAEEGAAGPAPEPVIVKKSEKQSKSKKKKAAAKGDLMIDQTARGAFGLPPLSLLPEPPESDGAKVDESYLKQTADRLVRVLADFAVNGEVTEIHPGPVVTMFEFQPKAGIKLSKIASLSREIAMALEVNRVRIVAPIPGKNAVGFELPNDERETVFIRDMISDEAFTRSKAKLPLALGKDISGDLYYVDLTKTPHLLIAGTTGSGKSVAVNAMLVSLLYKHTPEDLRLLLIDPKMIELGIYDGIPHLLLPVVTDMSKACLALKWAVDEMERRYQLFADMGARNLDSFNRKVEKLAADEDAAVVPDEAAEGDDGDPPRPKAEKLPTIVIVIDELAELMMVAAKDVETSITRLAQKARAAGIHLIVSTQRPSTDVITGLIKANFPVRISFRVSSGIDSRTILGTIGAENLLGRGDMLIIPPGSSDLKRVHGAFVDEEVRDIVDFLKAQGAPSYDEEILRAREDEGDGEISEDEKDEVYDQAVAIVAEERSCSISRLQRRLRIGYNRAARIVEIMEREGVVGPANGVNKREVLVSPQ